MFRSVGGAYARPVPCIGQRPFWRRRCSQARRTPPGVLFTAFAISFLLCFPTLKSVSFIRRSAVFIPAFMSIKATFSAEIVNVPRAGVADAGKAPVKKRKRP